MSRHDFSQTSERRYTGIVLFTLLCLTATVYWPGLSGGFVFDDFPNLVHNATLPLTSLSLDSLWQTALSNHSGPSRRPLSLLSFGLESYFFGLNPGIIKTTNLGIHLANGLLVFLLLRHIFRLSPELKSESTNLFMVSVDTAALITTALWLLAPINLTGVLFAIQRMESLATLFTLVGLIAYLIGRQRMLANRRYGIVITWGGVLGTTALGILAKESAAMLPVYAFILEYVLFRGRDASSRIDRRIWLLFTVVLVVPAILGGIWLLPGIISGDAYANRPFDLGERLWTESRALWSYITWTLFPSPTTLSLYHDAYPLSQGWLNPITTLTSVLGLVAITGAALWLRFRRPLITLGILWFIGGHLLVSTALPLELVYEHRNYLPSLGLLIIVTSIILTRQPHQPAIKTIRIVLMAGMIGIFGLLTFLRASTWGDPLLLAWTEARNKPQSPRAIYELGHTLTILAPGPSAPQFVLGMKSFEKAAKLPLSGLLPDQALIFLTSKHGLQTQAHWWSRMRSTIKKKPLAAQDITALHSLVVCKINSICHLQDSQLAQTLEIAVDKNPNQAKILTIYANFAANITHDYLLALELMQRSVALKPRNIQFWNNLITLQIALKQKEFAKNSLERARELNPRGSARATLASLESTYHKQFILPPESSTP